MSKVPKTNHILIVEDDEDVSNLMMYVAKEEGFIVSLAVTGPEAFSLIAANRELYDCAILDLGLPGMNGEDVIEHLDRLGCETQIIVYSASVNSEIYQRLQRFDTVVSCHNKPVSIAIVRSILQSIRDRGELHSLSAKKAVQADAGR